MSLVGQKTQGHSCQQEATWKDARLPRATDDTGGLISLSQATQERGESGFPTSTLRGKSISKA